MLDYRILSLPSDASGAGVLSAVILYDGQDLVLSDAGLPGHHDALAAQLGLHGFSVADITKVVISHHDHDHMGGLAELKRANPQVEVIAHALEAPYIAGDRRSLRLEQALKHTAGLRGAQREQGRRFFKYLAGVLPCAVDRTVEADRTEIVPGLITLNTPGHTPGHISLLIAEQAVVLAGDALAVTGGRLGLANPEFTLDTARANESVDAIVRARPRTIVCYHGGEVDAYVLPVRPRIPASSS